MAVGYKTSESYLGGVLYEEMISPLNILLGKRRRREREEGNRRDEKRGDGERGEGTGKGREKRM